MSKRLAHCLDRGLLELPVDARILCVGPVEPPPVPRDQTVILHPERPVVDALMALGWRAGANWPSDPVNVACVTLPRARDRAQGWIAAAAGCVGTDGLVVVDGAKTEGADALARAVAARQDLEGQVTKAHGRCFWFRPSADFSDWQARPRQIDGFQTWPGVFSADAPDPGSVALAKALPNDLRGAVADLGAGWGYLGRSILGQTAVTRLYEVEADHDALTCARSNLPDPRVQFEWADATRWRPPEPVTAVVMNPPFHKGRAGDPGLGQAFIRTAAAALTSRGRLFMVANRHLPYEATLTSCFGRVTTLDETGGFKVILAEAPRAAARHRLS